MGWLIGGTVAIVTALVLRLPAKPTEDQSVMAARRAILRFIPLLSVFGLAMIAVGVVTLMV